MYNILLNIGPSTLNGNSEQKNSFPTFFACSTYHLYDSVTFINIILHSELLNFANEETTCAACISDL